MEELETRVLSKDLTHFPTTRPRLPQQCFEHAWTRWQKSAPFGFTEEEVVGWKTLVRSAVTSPVDKVPTKAMLLCPKKWAEATMEFADNMRVVPTAEINLAYDVFFRLGQTIHGLPYCSLRRSDAHEFGVVKSWPKQKSLDPPPQTWSQVSWRPVVAYTLNHWRVLLSLFGRMCMQLMVVLRWGYAVGAPRDVIKRANEFNRKRRSMPNRVASVPGEETLQALIFDIKEFFLSVNVDEFRYILRIALHELRTQFPNALWF